MAIEKDLGAVSAYAIAVENGFEGTIEEWLESLRYDHSDEFGVLAGQVQENAESAAASASAADQSKQAAAQSAAAAQLSANTSASKAGEASTSASAAAASALSATESAELAAENAEASQLSAETSANKAGESAASAQASAASADEAKAAVGKIKIIGTDGKTYLGVITAVSGKPVFEYEEYVEGTDDGTV